MIGVQEPTFSVHPPIADESTVEDALELAEIAGIELLPWQREQVRIILGMTDDGEWAASRYGCSLSRQNGKGVVIETVVLAKTILLAEKVLWTAHHGATMVEAFTRFRGLLESTPTIADQVAAVRAATGREQIEFKNGALVKFSARSKSAARGLGFQTIIADEAQEWMRAEAGAMLPVLSGQRDERTQTILFGTPPYDRRGEVFSDTRAAAYSGGDARLAWSEWSCETTDRESDVSVWARCNPSLGTIIMPDKIEDELASLQGNVSVFRRERLGEWGKATDTALALDQAQWAAGAVEEWPARDEQYTFTHGPLRVIGVDTTFNAEMTTMVEAVPLEDGRVGLVVIDSAPGLFWVGGAFADVREETANVVAVFDPLRTGDLTADLRDVGVRDAVKRRRIHSVSSRELTFACDALVRAVREGRVVHSDPRLDAAAAGATRSTFDDGKGWKLVGVDGADVSPLIAAGLALSVLREQRKAGPRQRLL